jgi:hypothetical protein
VREREHRQRGLNAPVLVLLISVDSHKSKSQALSGVSRNIHSDFGYWNVDILLRRYECARFGF